MKRDFFITDQYGNIWNDESYPTFKRAAEFRDVIKKDLNHPLELKIVCVEIESYTREVSIDYSPKAKDYEDSDF